MGVLAWSHALVTALILLTLPIPLAARKGGRAHRRAGWVFVAAMGYEAVSGLVLAAHHIATGDARTRASMVFFVLIGWLTLTLLVLGVRVLRVRRRAPPLWAPIDLFFPAVLAVLALVAPFVSRVGSSQAGKVSTLAISEVGAGSRQVIALVFAALSLLLAVLFLGQWLRPPRRAELWFRGHLQGTIGAAIGGLTGLSVQMVRYVPVEYRDGALPVVMLFWPSVAGSALMIFFVLRYRDRFERHLREDLRQAAGALPAVASDLSGGSAGRAR